MTLERDEFLIDQFPSEFKFGLATSAYQVEGAWNLDGKGESNWDAFCHDKTRPRIADGKNGDICCDQYHKYKEDVKILKDMGAKVYRFSISWTRILPNGTKSVINQPGIDYYNRLIDELVVNGIEPMITLFHWDTPATFKDDWLDESLIDHFGDLARICFTAFGDRVKYWLTINEPFVYTDMGYARQVFPPANGSEPGVLVYRAAQNLLKAHATAYHIYTDEFKEVQKGRIGITLDCGWYQAPENGTEADARAAERGFQFRMGWFAHPIFKGDYPPVMREYIDRKSKAEGRTESRFPTLEPEWIEKIKGTSDFLGLNHYTTHLVTDAPNRNGLGTEADQDSNHIYDPNWPTTAAFWLRPVPWSFRKLLNWIKNEYNNPDVFITENGVCTKDNTIEDTVRVEYFRIYINEVLKAIKLDGCNIIGYLAWSLLDVFEWSTGYTITFGVISVDHNSPERTRTPKASAQLLTSIFKNHGFIKNN